MTVKDQCFVCDAPTFFQDWPDEEGYDPFYEPDFRALPLRGRAGGASPLSRCASQPKALVPNAERNH